MSKGRILVVEDDADISNMLRIYFSGQGYDVQVAPRGGDALNITRKQSPNLIVLDIMLPDMDGYAVCRELRQTTRTKHIPIIFLTQRDERSDKLIGLEMGADDYITKPFDIEELKYRVRNSIERVDREKSMDPRSNLPSSRLIEEQLRELMRTQNTWYYMDLKINGFDAFQEVYGMLASTEIMRFVALILGEIVDELGTGDDFIGHAGNDNFVIITYSPRSQQLKERVIQRFNDDVKQHYSFIDRERGHIVVENGETRPLMTMGVGIVSNATQRFADIREITELAADARRRPQGDSVEPIETSW
ncbi:MAG TPA: response regulator [Aggregatilineales bacterium]|nr:response regulator [Anaerolineales bacterium]HRE46488.1 response regulator [Aggregatilineales bacterium]